MAKARGKIVVLLVIYFAGFATAIYTLAPSNHQFEPTGTTVSASVFRSDKFARSFSTAMHKYAALAGEASKRAAAVLKEKWEQRPPASVDSGP
jgi:hypothetical protein